MYKLLLCWRYLRTRFLALVCIVSVMLGVATLIVVNSVMSGFSTKLQGSAARSASDIVIETPNIEGFPYSDEDNASARPESSVAQHIEAMTPTIEVVAMVNFEVGDSRYDTGSGIRPGPAQGDPADSTGRRRSARPGSHRRFRRTFARCRAATQSILRS